MGNEKRLFLAGIMTAAVLLSHGRPLAADPLIQRPSREEIKLQLRRAPRFAGPGAAAPDAFRVEYVLSEDADLSVTLLNLHLMPMRTFHVPAGEPGSRAGVNSLTVWDGADSAGASAPAGEYWAALSFRYADGRVENKRFRLVKL